MSQQEILGHDSVESRFWAKVDRPENWQGEGAFHCWNWTACKDAHGYGLFRLLPSESMKRAHRISFEWIHGKIPSDLELDHLCRNRACVNPNHLQAVSHKLNVYRGKGIAIHRCDLRRRAGFKYSNEVVPT